ncbi:Coagulation factor 5/8 C-terminal domain [Trinorchestia longiramus]|nr:Coagulation factor 5/8 C-terminal domain [Trinorchestia longiramus]
MNESRMELNDAIVRVLLPKPVQFVDSSDTQVCNITNNFTNNHYLDFDITNLFFTDYLELNLTVTVDPNNDMIKGLGLIDAAALVRLVCTTFSDSNPKYCGSTVVLPFQIDGTECFEPLGLGTMDVCQFSASTAITKDTGPDKAKPNSGGVWSPAVRSGPGWEHHITIDFLKKTRVTKIEFTSTDVNNHKAVTEFKVSYSFNGASFISPCDTVITVTNNVAELPSECRFQARYGRLTIVDSTTVYDKAFGVNFVEWYGCPIETIDDTCAALETVFTDGVGWRQISYDTANKILYFCDYNPKKMRTVCFSTADGSTWNALPSYIGSLVGESGGLFYAKDSLGSATVSSTDGINWIVTDSATAAGLTTSAQSVPGEPNGLSVGEGGYKADFTGILFGDNYIVKWESCCS